MPDEAQTPEPPAQRRTAMQVATDAQSTAEAALALAQTLDEANRQMPEQLASAVEDLQVRLTDVDQRLRDLPQATEQLDFATVARLEELDARVAATLQPLAESQNILVDRLEDFESQLSSANAVRSDGHDALAQRLDRADAALKAATEETGGFMGAVNRKLDDLRTRVAQLEERSGRPVADDQKPHLTQEVVDGLLARIEALESRPAGGGENVGLTWDAIAERVTNQAKVEVQKHLALIAPGGAPGAGPVRPRGVQRKVLELMRTVDSIGKDRQAEKSAGGYRFRGIDEAMDAVGHAMRSIGLIGSPQIRSVEYDTNVSNNHQGRPILWTTARVVGAYVFTDPEDGSTHPIEIVGEGRDNSDKATSKASSMALKYGLLHGLMIPVRGMPDGDAENPEVFRDRDETAPDQPARQQQAQSAQPPAQQATPQERAQRAVAAFQGLEQIQGQERYNRFVAMGNFARNEGLMDIEVDWKGQRAPLHYFVSAVEMLLFGTTSQQTPPPGDSQGGYADEPPWDEGR